MSRQRSSPGGNYSSQLLLIVNADGNGDATAHAELSYDFATTRFQGGDQIVQDSVGDVFMKHAFISEGPEIEFERLRLDNLLIRHIAYGDAGEIGLACGRADTGEFVGG